MSLKYENIALQDNLSIVVTPERIIDVKIKQLRNKAITLVKVLWKGLTPEEATWEIESELRQKYPHLFNQGMLLILRTNSVLSRVDM